MIKGGDDDDDPRGFEIRFGTGAERTSAISSINAEMAKLVEERAVTNSDSFNGVFLTTHIHGDRAGAE